MTFTERMKQEAIHGQKVLLLPEGNEIRTLKAAAIIKKENLAKDIILLGKEDEIKALAEKEGVDITGLHLIDPTTDERKEEFAQTYYEMRKHKEMTIEKARVEIIEPLKWACMMSKLNYTDAIVAGAESTTGNVLKAAFTIIGTTPGTKYASSCFVMETNRPEFGSDGSLIFSDCAVIPFPSVEQHAAIAIASADSCRTFLEVEPKVAMLSYSTKGSAKGEKINHILDVVSRVKELAPEIEIDGELQLDAAICERVGEIKAPGSHIAGHANTLIFPDLQAGNIGYKLVQRIAGANAYGPILQGFAKPISDLSRGCSVDDIVVTSAITLAQASKMN